MTRLTARGVAPGTAVGRALVAVHDAQQVRYRLATSGVDRERHRLRNAQARTRSELEDISARIARTVGRAQAAIFAAQLLMLDDPLLVRRADELIRGERINAEWALAKAIDEVHDVFARDGDAWLRERAGDLADVGGRLQRNLRPGQDLLADLPRELEPPLILVVDELPPSAAAQLDWTRVRGVVSDAGSPTSHTMILVRSMGVPAVVGLSGATRLITPGQTLALDGTSGEIVVDPTEDVLAGWRERSAVAEARDRALSDARDEPAATADGVRIRLDANLEIADEVGRVLESGAEGIGLYRSEFLLDALSPDAVDEKTQYETYRALLAAMHPRPVTIRTFDVGEDRFDPLRAGMRRDRFGLRGVRAAIRHDEQFVIQVRALLRASSAGTLRILLPFVTAADEVRQARAVIADVAADLGITTPVPIGAMIEVPAAALTVDQLARHADFLSVGTNDLIQYTLAVDRADERLTGQSDPASPAVLRLLKVIAAAGRRAGRELAVCGEMAADPVLVAALVGLGFRAFSMTPAAIPTVKRALARIDARVARTAAHQALRAPSVDAVHAILAALA